MLPEDAVKAILLVTFLAIPLIIVALVTLLKRSFRRPRTRTCLIREDHHVRVAPEGVTGANRIVRTLPRSYRPREHARHGVHPRSRGWKPLTLNSSRPAPFGSNPDLETGLTSPGNGGISRATASPPIVPGGHPGCVLGDIAGEDDHFVQGQGGLQDPSPPRYWAYELYEVPSYEAAVTSNREGARSIRIFG